MTVTYILSLLRDTAELGPMETDKNGACFASRKLTPLKSSSIHQGIMSSIASNLGDAVRSNGTLKDASEIIWSYDADETIPFPPCTNSHDAHTPSGMHAPATTVTTQALRRTTRTICPCQHYLEADNKAELASSTVALKVSGIKRKAANDLPGRCATRKSITTVVSDNSSDDRAPSPSPPPTEPASDDYEVLQAMANADNQVRSQ